MNIRDTLVLNNGVNIPRLGFGIYKVGTRDTTLLAIEAALDAGYRLFDTATIYANEAELGMAISNSNILRSDVFLTTKLWNDDHGYDSTLKAFELSLKNLQTDYVDLYLIHWPLKGKRIESYKALEEIYQSGRARAIGVSNYMKRHLEELLENCSVVPALNQVEFNPFLYQRELLEYCQSKSIVIEAYCPLARMKFQDDETILKVSRKYSKSQAQILIKWALQTGVVVIPKSSNPSRIKENIEVFDFKISDDDMAIISSLNRNYHVSWNPTNLD